MFSFSGAAGLPGTGKLSAFEAGRLLAGWELVLLGAKGIVEVDVKTGRSVRRTGAGVAVFGGSHVSISCCGTDMGSGPSGW